MRHENQGSYVCPVKCDACLVFSQFSIPSIMVSSEVSQSCPTLCDPMDCILHPWDFPGKSTGVDCHFPLQGIFLTQGSNHSLPHYWQTLLPSEPPGKYPWPNSNSVELIMGCPNVAVVQLPGRVWLFVTPWTAAWPGFPVLHHLPKLAQIHVCLVGDASQSSHPLSSHSSALNLFQHQGIF